VTDPGRVIRVFARRRVPLGFLTGAFVLWLAEPTGVSLVAGGLLGAAGEALRIWAAGHISKSREVTTSGPYRYLAHPLYAGSAVIGAGLGVASGSVIAAALIAACLAATLPAAIKSEEAFLRRTFGERYDEYRRGAAPRATPARRFSWRQAVANGEHRTLFGFAVVALLLVAKATYNGSLG
jgi:protein-S-isoprenylcysteine O-methyltransferase Ste14